jgi:hypothetical protein
MATSPHPSPTNPERDVVQQSPGLRTKGDDTTAARHHRVTPRKGLLLVALVIFVVIAVSWVALVRQGSDTTSPGASTGAAPSESNPYDSAYGTFPPVTTAGRGRATIPLPAGGRTTGIFSWRTSPNSFFDAVLRADDGTRVDWPLGPLDVSTGSVPYGLAPVQPSDPDAVLDSITVRTQGPWSVTIGPISSAEELPVAGATGLGLRTFLHSGPAAEWVITHRPHPRLWDGVSAYQWLVGAHPPPHFPEPHMPSLEPYARSQPLRLLGGPSVVVISAWSRWTIAPR